MPIYEYACPQCHKNFEEWLKLDDDASSHPCPHCGASASRIISQTTFILKGGGWYVTEYGSHHTEAEEAPHEASADASSETPSEAKTDAAKPEKSGDKSVPAPAASPTSSASPTLPPSAPPSTSGTAKPAPATSGTKPAQPAASTGA